MNYIRMLCDLAAMKKNTILQNEEIQAMQNYKLRKMLHYAWENSEFYRKTFETAGITQDQLDTLPLSAFPTIDKKIVMENFDELVTISDITQERLREFDGANQEDKEDSLKGYHIVHSSGSTEKPSYFLYDEMAWYQMLLGIIRAALWDMNMVQILKLLIKRPKVIYIAATDGNYGGAMAVGDGIEGVGAKKMYLDIKTPLSEWIESIRKFKPNIIIGYPSAIKILADLVEEGKLSLSVVRVISCGEPLAAGLRTFLEKTFRCPVVNIYGASESLALGVETGKEEGIILFDDLNIIEVENGEMFLTSLYNFEQPLIRYKISDRLVLKEPMEKSPFARAEIVLGRNEDLLWFEDVNGNRDFLHPLSIEGFCVEGLKDYQFKQVSKDSFVMLAEIVADEKELAIALELNDLLKQILEEKNLSYVTFKVEFVKEILPCSKTGKKPLVVVKKTFERTKAV